MATPMQTPQADPKMQNIAQRLVLAAQKIIYDPQISRRLIDAIRQGEDPVSGIVSAALLVIDQLREHAKGIQPDMVYAVAPAVIAFLFELASAAKIPVQPQMMAQARQALLQQIKARIGGGQPQGATAGASAAGMGPGMAPGGMQGMGPKPGLIGAMGG